MKKKSLILKLVAAMLFSVSVGATSVAAMESSSVKKIEGSQVSELEKKFMLDKLIDMGFIVSDEKKFLEEFNLSKLKLLADKIEGVLGKIKKLQNLEDLKKLDLENEIKNWKVSVGDVKFLYNFPDIVSDNLLTLKYKFSLIVRLLSNPKEFPRYSELISDYKNYLNRIDKKKREVENKKEEIYNQLTTLGLVIDNKDGFLKNIDSFGLASLAETNGEMLKIAEKCVNNAVVRNGIEVKCSKLNKERIELEEKCYKLRSEISIKRINGSGSEEESKSLDLDIKEWEAEKRKIKSLNSDIQKLKEEIEKIESSTKSNIENLQKDMIDKKNMGNVNVSYAFLDELYTDINGLVFILSTISSVLSEGAKALS